MTITFFSNFLNDHQLPFCQAMIEKVGEDNFRFVASSKIDQDRVAMGFADMNEIYPFVVKAYNGGSNLKDANDLMLNSDVVIIGSEKGMPVDERIMKGKLTFRYNERLLKRGDWLLLDPRVQSDIYKRFCKYRRSKYPLYVLCASAYTARDLSLCGFPKSKCLKWGYFPIVKEYENVANLIKRKHELSHQMDVSILWAGRLIEWKHPEVPVIIAKRLKENGIKFSLKIVGIGNCEQWVRNLISQYNLSDCVSILGALPPIEVRKQMEESEVFLFTSDKNEGWGAVLNESMNSACVVIADDRIGSVPFMIQDGVNGFTYHKGNMNELYSKLMNIINDKALRNRIAYQAYYSMSESWNAEVAVNRLLEMIDIYNGSLVIAKDYGPCSKCE